MSEDAHGFCCQCCSGTYCQCSMTTCGACMRCYKCCRCAARNFRPYREKADALAVYVNKAAENKRADANLTGYDKMLLKGMLIGW